MKKITLSIILALLIAGNYAVHAQAARIEKFGVVLTREDHTTEWYLENTTKDSIKVFVVNHQDRIEKLPGGVIAVSEGDGKHAEIDFTIGPGQKLSLNYIICYHSIGLMIGTKSESTLIQQQFYTYTE